MSAQIRDQVRSLLDSLDSRQLLAVRLYIEELTRQRPQRPASRAKRLTVEEFRRERGLAD